MYLTGEKLICDMVEVQYDAFIALIDAAREFPRMALQLVKSAIQAATFLVFEVARATVVTLEQDIIKLLKIDDIDLSKTKNNFCEVAFACTATREMLFRKFSTLDDVNDYEKFENIVCKQGLRSLLEDWVQEDVLNVIDGKLQELIDDIQKAFEKVNNVVQQYIDELLEKKIFGTSKTFQEWIEELDKYAGCVFGLCNFDITSSNKKEDLLHDAGVEQTGSGFVFVLNKYNEFLSEKETLEEYILSLKTKIEVNTQSRGVPVENMQKTLTNKGFYQGPIDGNYTEELTNAVKEFQKQQNLIDNGVAGLKTLRALGLVEDGIPLYDLAR